MKKEKKIIIINKDTCIGCGSCEFACPEIFELKGGKATIKEDANLEKEKDCIKKAIDNCPVAAIRKINN